MGSGWPATSLMAETMPSMRASSSMSLSSMGPGIPFALARCMSAPFAARIQSRPSLTDWAAPRIASVLSAALDWASRAAAALAAVAFSMASDIVSPFVDVTSCTV